MTGKAPVVSIGFPVYNGERYLRVALDALLAQDFADFELVLSDNGSSDATGEICRDYAARDTRIRYHRQVRNQGPTWNFNYVAERASGEFFMWAAHDDSWRKDFISRTLAALRADETAVCCHSHAQPIDSRGVPQSEPYIDFVNQEPTVRRRWRRMMAHWELHAAIYGLMRTAALRRTRLLRPGLSSDLVFMAELALHGGIIQVPETLSWKRVPDAGSAYRTPEEMLAFLSGPGDKRQRRPRLHRLHVAFECLGGLEHARLDRSLERQLALDTFAVYCTHGYWSIDLREAAAALLGRRYVQLVRPLKRMLRESR
ncbi:MAG: glycosyl transferase [bacterium]|nr:glycosyl transferase [bacterium]